MQIYTLRDPCQEERELSTDYPCKEEPEKARKSQEKPGRAETLR